MTTYHYKGKVYTEGVVEEYTYTPKYSKDTNITVVMRTQVTRYPDGEVSTRDYEELMRIHYGEPTKEDYEPCLVKSYETGEYIHRRGIINVWK